MGNTLGTKTTILPKIYDALLPHMSKFSLQEYTFFSVNERVYIWVNLIYIVSVYTITVEWMTYEQNLNFKFKFYTLLYV